MVSEVWEFDAAKAVFDEQLQFLRSKKKQVPDAIHYGAMLEVPALAEMLDLLLPKLSFLSVGTNDLTQFLFAADRANPMLAERYDWLSRPIIRFLRRVTRDTEGSGISLGVCGEMGGRRLEALALLGIGFRRLSITPAAVGPIKELICQVDLAELESAMEKFLADPGVHLRSALSDWAAQQGIEFD